MLITIKKDMRDIIMSVYDCTMFHWEFEMLELRMRELWDVVDKFYVTESRYDHRGKPRELVLNKNLFMFDWAKEKLVVKISDMPNYAVKSWDFENYQRLQSVKLPLEDFDPKEDDLFIISDIIHKRSLVFVFSFKPQPVVAPLKNNLFSFLLNSFLFIFNTSSIFNNSSNSSAQGIGISKLFLVED